MDRLIPPIKDLFSLKGTIGPSDHEYQEPLFSGRQFHLERIVSMGHVTPPGQWYDQPRNEWVLLASGNATLQFENGQLVHLTAGNHIMIPAGLKHRVSYTDTNQPSIWLAIHFDE